MKTAKPPSEDMRAEYRREDLGLLVRGKYAARYAKATNVVVIDPALTKAFPNCEAVNEALRGLLALTEQTARLTGGPKRVPRKRVAAQRHLWPLDHPLQGDGALSRGKRSEVVGVVFLPCKSALARWSAARLSSRASRSLKARLSPCSPE